ncbi:MAG: O-antigen ligase family protein [Bacteroidota bacterium]
MTTFGLYLASRFKLREQLNLVAIAFGITALVSAFCALAVPSIGIAQGKFGGAWIGIYTHKNSLGKFMSLSVAIFALIAADNDFYKDWITRLFALGGLFLSFSLVIFSTSGTGFAVAIVSLIVLYSYRFYQDQGKRRRLYLEIITLVTIVLITAIASSWQDILLNAGKDITLTGRTEIWGVSLYLLFKERLLFGFGRGAFWAPGSQFAELAGAAVGNQYIPPHSHNGFIDLMLDIGCIGLLLFIISFILSYRNAITRSFVSRRAKDLWPMILLSWLFFYNFTESSILTRSNIFWPLYISAVLCAKPSGRVIYLKTSQEDYIRSSTSYINESAKL